MTTSAEERPPLLSPRIRGAGGAIVSDKGMSRRRVLQSGLVALALPPEITLAAGKTLLTFRLKETAGLRRFGFPVHAVLPKSVSDTDLRLVLGEREIPAQFRAVRGPDGVPSVALDFNASPGPLESQQYAVVAGGGKPGLEPREGMRVERAGGAFQVYNRPSWHVVVPGDLLGFLRGVTNANTEFVREGAEGLSIGDTDGNRHRVGVPGAAMRAAVTREGPLSVGLRFEGTEVLPGNRSVVSAVDMTLPNSKSWVETTWRVDDPEGAVSSLGVDLNLKLDGKTTLVDFGANTTVYGYLKGDERMNLVAGAASGLPKPRRAWAVRKGAGASPGLFAEARDDSPPAEGWAHVMDASRCTALAVAEFGRETLDRIEVEAGGRIHVERRFAGGGDVPAKGPKVLTFWLHFVSMPVQVGALTSPQAMLAPLTLTWDKTAP